MNGKKNNPCEDCGGMFHPCAMDFDHVKGEKLYAVSELVLRAWSFEKIQEEIDKCELVCANCHRLRTYLRLQD